MKLMGLFLFALPAFAEGPNFETFKAEAIKNIDERIGKMQEHKACVSSAANKDAMKACREKMKDWREEEKEERMQKRSERMEKRKMKKSEQKSMMEENNE
jgi:ribosomal protein L12E/L44/L45/RPP1/RPP2